MDTISLLTTLDERYLPQLQVLLTSLHVNNPGERFALHLLHSGIPRDALAGTARRCGAWGWDFFPAEVDGALFAGAPVSRQYPREMYYRLLAPRLLPGVDRILYLDPDILVINPIRPLWEQDLAGKLFAAAAHTGKTELASSVNQLRLGTEGDYYNSGVLVMDLAAGRREIEPRFLFDYVARHRKELVLPDQDVLNALFSRRILPLEDALWNYDARNYSTYFMRSGGVMDVRWVMDHTAILHFCGKEKPWKPKYFHRFGILYQHYARLARREEESWQ
ncbi:glycosyltransferase family 8 protein [uncultured Oscillibacter sp.]|uniref:glycosyltransferase family 8 protein n=1 Tax=uncultured Oscillibacter sp. TaxID=876091 RepID=UPI0025F7CC3E|nr:glycosyltransferase family 8 protein [uncultured Oscillibacter sp.]